GIIVINPNFEAVGETKITSQNYDAEFGQATAGVVSVQTKSGTNELHGSVFAFRQSDELQARNSFSQDRPSPATGKLIPDSLRNQFGGSIGGPIIKEKLFFFGDYQGTRSKTGGTQLVTVPTDLARTGDLSEYGINIFDPLTGDPNQRTQFAGNIIPADRLSPQALNLLNLLPRANRPGTSNNFAGAGSEIFDNDTFDIRIDGRRSANLNLFGRYSFGNFNRDGPAVFGNGGGKELVSLGGTSAVRNQSIAIGFDYVLSPTTVVDFRFGFFHYKVDVLPFDFGGSASADAGIPGLNLDDNFTSGLSAFTIENDFGFNFGSGLGVNRCNCPLQEDEKQFQFVGNVLKTVGNHSLKFGIDVRRAYNLRIPSDQHRSGELFFNPSRTRGPESNNPAVNNNGLGLAAFLLGDVSRFQRFSSQSTDARERQWRHYYYAQDTWRATPKLTLNYGLRLDVINPQTLNEPGNGGFLDLQTGEIRVAGVGGNGLNGDVRNSLNFAPRLGIAYQITNKTVIRAGYGRSYDIGVFGSLFGHSVTQNLPVLSAQQLNGSANFASVFNLAQGPPPVVFPTVGDDGRVPLPPGVFARALPEKQQPPTVDAYNVTVQHQLTNTITVEAAYVGNKGTHVFTDNGPTINVNEATLVGFGNGPGTPGFVPLDQRRPFFNSFGWTQNIDFFCNCGDNRYDSL
ncbi:MAG: TonB-dependent receptor domain-containing protein, partial [Pyrinomonadaceae bacterium]